MGISRRQFVKTSAIAATFAAVGLDGVAHAQSRKGRTLIPGITSPVQIPTQSQLDPVFYFRKSTFIPYLNSSFRVSAGNAKPENLTLVEVSTSRQAEKLTSNPNATEDSFSLLFSGPAKAFRPQGVYTLEHAALGSFSLLLVPVNRRNGKSYFAEAVISHLLP